jgi:hypothetical protein
MSLRQLLFKVRSNPFVGSVYRSVRNLAQGPGWGGFHRDPIYGGLVLDLLSAFKFTSFVETGTFRGYTTELIATRHPELTVYSSEVVQSTYDAAHRALKKYPNIKLSLKNSDEWIAELLKTGELGAQPFFFLDAHWQTYWPLRAELRHISDAGIKAVSVIDDFEVPGRPDFGFDVDGGGQLTAGEKCNLDYIRPSLGAQNRYKALFPKYAYADAFGQSKVGALRGHIVLFQNMDEEYAAALSRPFVQKHYQPHGDVR